MLREATRSRTRTVPKGHAEDHRLPDPVPVWTEQRVREELPAVRVLLEGTLRVGHVRGRRNPYATVFVETPTGDLTMEATWTAVAHVLNTGRWLSF